jgi:putative membrane protein
MNLIIRLLITAVAVMVTPYIVQGVSVHNFGTAVVVAIVLAILNATVKPILEFLTFPITIITLGLFLLVINVVIIYIASYFVGGFRVTGFFPALWFSVVVWLVSWLLSGILGDKR